MAREIPERGAVACRPRQGRERVTQAIHDLPLLDPRQRWALWCGRFQDAAWIPNESVDAIITDPPYGREWLPLYEDLADFAARVLKPGGVCLVMTGQLILPDVIAILRRRLQYVWLISYVSTGHAALVWPIRVMSHSKPVLYFAKPPHNPTGLFRPDLISSGQKTKREHEWQQSVAGFRNLIRHYTQPNSLILDPCCGTGTTLVAAIMEGGGGGRSASTSTGEPSRSPSASWRRPAGGHCSCGCSRWRKTAR
jgi:hypothetical protein